MKKAKFMSKLGQKALALSLSAVLCLGAGATALAAETEYPITYSNGKYTFEKISHSDSPLESADGVVDYVGNGSITPFVNGESAGNGDRGQSYSYASAVYGEWVYINTMYGGLGVSTILSYGMSGMSPEQAKAMMDVMYNGNLYTGEPDGKYAGGILFKFNVKTGETKILMSRDTNGKIPTFRSALEKDGKLYFVGMVVDITKLTQQEIATAIARQNGFPCIYEVDPENNDKLTCVYDCVDVDGFRELVADNVFTSTRAICTYKDSVIAGCLDTDGVFLSASDDPSKGQDSFKVIATMDDLYNYPAYHRQDVNGGGGIYQAIEFNGKLYVVICTGTEASKDPTTGTLQTFAIVRGECNGEVTDKDAWTWTVLVGDEKDGAKYPFGIDKDRISCGACTLEVYKDYLYIGDYNDVSSALQGFVLKKDFTTQATNLEQSVNLYRMDKDENIEMVVGDPTEQFPEGGISGMGSGYETHMSQYTWQTTVYEGKLYVSTMDTTTLLEPIAQFTNGDLVNMSDEEWERQINYIKVFVELLKGNANTTSASNKSAVADKLIDNAIASASITSTSTSTYSLAKSQDIPKVTITSEQRKALREAILNGEFANANLSTATKNKLNEINGYLDQLTMLYDTNDFSGFSEIYDKILELIKENLPDSVKNLYDMIMSYATSDNIKALLRCIPYMATSKAGFDLYEIDQKSDGSVTINTITNNGFGDRYNHGLRIFAKTSDYFVIGTANPFYGTQIWRRANSDKNDLNYDGKVDVNDATYFQTVVAGSEDKPDDYDTRFDYTDDGIVDVNDITAYQFLLSDNAVG